MTSAIDLFAEELHLHHERFGNAPAYVELSLNAANDIREDVAKGYGVVVGKLTKVGKDSTFYLLGVECRVRYAQGYIIYPCA